MHELFLGRERAVALRRYWFVGADDGTDIRPGHAAYTRWFGARPEVDAEVRHAFAADMQAARAGACAAWSTSAEKLALVLLLDQVPRHVHRGEAAAFASDATALALARECLRQGMDAELRLVERVFLLLPLQHSERLCEHEGVVDRLEDALHQARRRGLAITGFLAAALQAEHAHQAELERFGRYPGRNAALGRASTPAERAHLRALRAARAPVPPTLSIG